MATIKDLSDQISNFQTPELQIQEIIRIVCTQMLIIDTIINFMPAEAKQEIFGHLSGLLKPLND